MPNLNRLTTGTAQVFKSIDDRVVAGLVAAIVLFAILQPLVGLPTYYLGFISGILVFCVFALGYNFLHGHTGLISFGHAGFLLVGAYAGALTLEYLGNNAWLGLLMSLVVSVAFSFLVGFASVRIRGIYFSLLTLAFSMLPYILVRTILKDWTGGHMGMQFRTAPHFFFDLSNPMQFLFFSLGVLVLMYLAMRFMLNSHFGYLLRGVRDNELKLEGLGYNTQRIKLAAVLISGTISGFAGYLLLLHLSAISPSLGFYFTSAKVIFVSIIGGVYSIAGPIVGTFFWYLVEEFLVRPGFLEITLGILLIVVILRFPSGFMALLRRGTQSAPN